MRSCRVQLAIFIIFSLELILASTFVDKYVLRYAALRAHRAARNCSELLDCVTRASPHTVAARRRAGSRSDMATGVVCAQFLLLGGSNWYSKSHSGYPMVRAMLQPAAESRAFAGGRGLGSNGSLPFTLRLAMEPQPSSTKHHLLAGSCTLS